MSDRPNIVFLLADQLRACSLPLWGGGQIETPHLDRLAAEGVTLDNVVSTCPVCTPYRSMLLTGRHPQTTGHIINFVRTRHDEIGLGDVFGRAGYRTAWIGKWHLHTGSFPQVGGPDWVPEGRDRLGFDWWRGYNFHAKYFNGWVNTRDWHNETWDGYETDALNRYAFEFMDSVGDDPFCVFLSPHQPHATGSSDYAPQRYYDRLPAKLEFPANVPVTELAEPPEGFRHAAPRWLWDPQDMYRHYLAMTLALDDMLGELMDYLARTGKADDTILIYTSDHGTQAGAHGIGLWEKKQPYQESMLVPFVARLPGVLDGGVRRDVLTSPVDLLPSLCGLCGVPIPPTVHGHDLSDAWRGREGAFEQDAVLCMNFGATYDHFVDGGEWRAVRTKQHTFTRWLDGRSELYDRSTDPLEMTNLADDPAAGPLRGALAERLAELQADVGDELVPCTSYAEWFDAQRRVIRNARGPLGDPEAEPDWSLLS